MEPNSPERTPNVPEYAPQPLNPEQLPNLQPEYEQSPERSQEQVQQSAPAQPLAVPTPVQLPTPVADSSTDDTNTTNSDVPTAAADEDLIEKEWVDKVKKIIADTKEDPYTREREVGKLQADYLKKRYGKELGST